MRTIGFAILLTGAIAGLASIVEAQSAGWILWEKNYTTKGTTDDRRYEGPLARLTQYPVMRQPPPGLVHSRCPPHSADGPPHSADGRPTACPFPYSTMTV
jgi:hypothetical protein